MTPSKRCADFIKSYEGCKLTAYLPTKDDVPTIGFGSTGADIKMGMTWTQAQADERFARDLASFGAGVSKLLGTAPTSQDEYDAMTSLAYNIGLGNFRESTLLRLHKEGAKDAASGQFARWNKQAGKVLNGLTRRRAGEAHMYGGKR